MDILDMKNQKIMEAKMWYGKPKFHYKVLKNNMLYYSCVSTAKYQDEVLNELIRRFKGENKPYKIFCNGNLVEIVNRGKSGRLKHDYGKIPS